MDDKIFDRIHEVDLKSTMETSYIERNCSKSITGCKRWT